MPKSDRRDRQRVKARYNLPTSRTFLHTLDRLAAERDRAKRAEVADHAFEGDGMPGASICSCGRYREEHLRFR